MDRIMDIAKRYNLYVVEDAAQAIDSYYKGHALGSIGHLSAFSFHETKNIQCGEGGMLVINDQRFATRAEIIREKGTNRSAFFRGEVDKYGWVDIGSSFLPSEITAAFLYAQLENIDAIQSRRKALWQQYYQALEPLQDQGLIKLPHIPDYTTNNAHMFYIVCRSLQERSDLIKLYKEHQILSVFHYLSLHTSEFYASKHDGRSMPNSDHYTDCLLRLPLYFELSDEEQKEVISLTNTFYKKRSEKVSPLSN
jgi:dTDP-4-amino-4,6-dideoxygalactose transaminase